MVKILIFRLQHFFFDFKHIDDTAPIKWQKYSMRLRYLLLYLRFCSIKLLMLVWTRSCWWYYNEHCNGYFLNFFLASFQNQLWFKRFCKSAYFTGNTDVTFTMSGKNDGLVTSGITTLEEYIQNGNVNYNGNSIAFVSDGCAVTYDNECQDQTSAVVSLSGVARGGGLRSECHHYGVTPYYEVKPYLHWFVVKIFFPSSFELKTNQFSGEDLFFSFCFGIHIFLDRKSTTLTAITFSFFFVFFGLYLFLDRKGVHHEIPPRVPPFLATPLVSLFG